jgi:glycolate oxidase FAD binding subunit
MTSPDAALHTITDQVRQAAAASTPLRIRGGGSKDFYGSGVPGELVGELLDTRPFAGITSYEPSELVVTVRAGTPLSELEAALADKGQCLPFEPPHFQVSAGAATVGGMVAAGLSGPARASAGGVRDYMLGVQIINGRAELLNFGGTVMKNVAGYDVSRLMAGALGTLGLITEVSLKVLPVAPAEATLRFDLGQAQALAQLHQWGAQPLPLNASRWEPADRHVGATRASADGQLWLRLRGAVAAVEAACTRMLQDTSGQRIDNIEAAPAWQACRNQRLPFFTQPLAPGMALWRLSVAQTAPALDLAWPQLVEWHGGLRWCQAPLDAAPELREAARRAGGNATVFIATYAISTRADGIFSFQEPFKTPLDAIHRRLKAEFDPVGIFNRGRLIPHT